MGVSLANLTVSERFVFVLGTFGTGETNDDNRTRQGWRVFCCGVEFFSEKAIAGMNERNGAK